jgi:hypothetical protein
MAEEQPGTSRLAILLAMAIMPASLSIAFTDEAESSNVLRHGSPLTFTADW